MKIKLSFRDRFEMIYSRNIADYVPRDLATTS